MIKIQTLMQRSDGCEIHTLMQRSDKCEYHTTLYADIELLFYEKKELKNLNLDNCNFQASLNIELK